MPESLARDSPEEESTAESNLRDSFIDKLITLIQVLVERLEGQDTDYKYNYGEGWHEEREETVEELLQSDEWNERIDTVEKLIEHYGRKKEPADSE